MDERAADAALFPPRVVNICAGQDTGGQGWRLKTAFDRHSDWSYRSVVSSRNYIGYPIDVFGSLRDDVVQRLWKLADVVHVRTWLRPFLPLDRQWPRPILLNHHGTAFREHAAELDAQARNIGAVQAVATVDLLQYADDLLWLPSPFDVDALAALRKRERRKPDGRIRIAHAPTNRLVKGTVEVIETVARLAKRYPIDFDLIENVSNAECLARKARADIFVDQLELGYGNNAIEAWGMGIPVVAGVVDPWTRAKMLELFGELPFVDATTDLDDVLETLIGDKAARLAAGRRGNEHVRRHHDERAVVAVAQAAYLRAIEQRSPHPIASMSRGQPFRPEGLIRVETSPGRWQYVRPKVAARYGVVA